MRPIVTQAWREIAVLAAAAVFSLPAAAHHSFAMFDPQHPVQVTGIVKSWQFTNPHSWLELVVFRSGQPVLYSVECASPIGLLRKGWSDNTFAVGEKISVVVNPLKNGADGGSFVKAIKANGVTLTQ